MNGLNGRAAAAVLLALLVALAAPLPARAGDRRWSTTLTEAFVTKYVTTGAGDILRGTGAYASPAWQQDLTCTDGRYRLGVWTSRQASNSLGMQGKLTDLDLTVERAFAMGRTNELTVGASRLAYPNSDFDVAHEWYATPAWGGPLSPALQFYWYRYPGDGVFPSAYLTLSRTLGGGPTLSCTLGFANGRTAEYYYGARHGGLADATVGLSCPLAIDERTVLTLDFNFQTVVARPLRAVMDDEDQAWMGLSLGREF